MEKRKKRKKKNKLWILQSVLCAVCMFSAALLYYDYVAVPRQNRELVEELKTCFPEDIPPGGGSPGQKPEQAGREPEVSAIDLRSLQSKYLNVRGWLTIPESGIDIRYCRAMWKIQSIICGEITGETTTSMEVCSSRQTVFWENPGI